MRSSTSGSTVRRRALAGLSAVALGIGGLVLASAPAQAAPTEVDGVELAWGINDEVGGGSFFGGCNFLVAGSAGDTGSSRLWSEADGFYSAQAGNVRIEKATATGGWEAPTWATKCRNSAGTAVTTTKGSTTHNRVVLSEGTGSVDVAAKTASVQWQGSFSVVFYGGLTYWTASNPVLTVAADGTGTLTATASGYGTDMDDMEKWVPIAPETITLATLKGVTLGADGFTVTPEYLGVGIDVDAAGVSGEQVRTGDSWGAFPQNFVDFQVKTGQAAYWYSSGGSVDPKKPTTPLSVAWDVPAPVQGSVTVSQTTLPADGTTEITVTGTGFTPSASIAARPPLAGKPGGAYVQFGRFGDSWKPSAGGTSANRTAANTAWAVPADSIATVGGASAGAVELSADGSFTATFTVSKAEADAKSTALASGTYGIYTYAGGGATFAGYETFTPITFVGDGQAPIEVEVPEVSTPVDPEPEPGEFVWTVAATPATLGKAEQTANGFTASGSLQAITVTDTRAEQPAFTINGSVGTFVSANGTFDGTHLGWTPSLSDNTVGAVAGAAVAPGVGLKESRTLVSAPAGHAKGTASVATKLDLTLPLDTKAGSYTGVLTLTAIG